MASTLIANPAAFNPAFTGSPVGGMPAPAAAPVTSPSGPDASQQADSSSAAPAVSDQFSAEAIAAPASGSASAVGAPLTGDVMKQIQAAAAAASAMPPAQAQSFDWAAPSSAAAASVTGASGAADVDPATVLADPSVKENLGALKQDAASMGARLNGSQAPGAAELKTMNGCLNGDIAAAQGIASQCGAPSPDTADAGADPTAASKTPPPRLDPSIWKMMSPTEKTYFLQLSEEDPQKALLFATQTKLQHLNDIITQLTQLATSRHDNAKAILQNWRV